jgi:hypothetical protein
LAVGLFVEAEILGRVAHNIYRVPRSALQANEQIYIVRDDNTLEFRDVHILRVVGEDIYISDGLESGETVCLSTLNNAIQGMRVRPVVEAELPSS